MVRSDISPRIIIHSLAHAIAAPRAAAKVAWLATLSSAPAAGIYAWPGWFGALGLRGAPGKQHIFGIKHRSRTRG